MRNGEQGCTRGLNPFLIVARDLSAGFLLVFFPVRNRLFSPVAVTMGLNMRPASAIEKYGLRMARLCMHVVVMLSLVLASGVCAAGGGVDELKVKAAYLLKFAQYVEWPPASLASSDAPLVLAVLAEDDMANAVDELVLGRRINGHELVVRRLQPDDTAEGVHMLFIGGPLDETRQRLLLRVQSLPILTVCEAEGAGKRGSVINFVTVDDQIRFEISLETARRNGLVLSSRLLSVAQQVLVGSP